MKRRLIVFSAVCLILVTTADAAGRKGRTELEFLGGWATESGAGKANHPDSLTSGETGADLDGWFVMGAIGRFLSDNLQIAAGGFGAWMDGSASARNAAVREFEGFDIIYDVDVDATVYGVGGRAKWHFSSQDA
jgi:hypothetical protein